MRNDKQQIIIWLMCGCLLVFAMVIIGGITRLTGSGLSITEWKVITGTFPPISESEWNNEFAKYQISPQFQKINSSFDVNDFKKIYWWEYLHRLVGRMIGIVFIIPFLFFYFKKQIDKKLLPKLLFIFMLGAWQGFLGWYMVSSGLVDNPFVSHYRLAIHLVNAFITFGYIFWVALDLQFEKISKSSASKNMLMISILTFLLLLIQITYGAFVAGLHAGHIFNTWPKMGDEWIASAVRSSFQNEGFESLFSNMSVVQFIHRTIALIIFCLVSWMWFSRKRNELNLSSQQQFAINISFVILNLQITLGIFTLLFSVPVWLGVTHQAVAFLIFAALIFQMHRLAKG
ncbi:MAG: COX15/CtaA family protein [Bacteroidota bacterium]